MSILLSFNDSIGCIVKCDDYFDNGLECIGFENNSFVIGNDIWFDIGFKYLDAPVKRVASKDVPIAYAPILEDEILVQTSWIENAIQEVIEF